MQAKDAILKEGGKRCGKCRMVKPASEFNRTHVWCRACRRANQAVYRRTEKHRVWMQAYTKSEKRKACQKKSRDKHRDAIRRRVSAWAQTPAGKISKSLTTARQCLKKCKDAKRRAAWRARIKALISERQRMRERNAVVFRRSPLHNASPRV